VTNAAREPAGGAAVLARQADSARRSSSPCALNGGGFELESWDQGRLIVNAAFAGVLRDAGLTTFEAVWSYSGGRVAKNLLRERTTTRIELSDRHGGETVLYLKRHAPPPWKEYIKPLVRLRRPILGAWHEWNAILRFHEIGIRTMTPAALGRSGGHSLLLTDAIQGCRKLSELAAACELKNTRASQLDSFLTRIAAAARMMHAAGLHHQDFYLTHLLVPEPDDGATLFVIDLGRVQQRRRLARRWIVKDLGQLSYSAAGLDDAFRRRFLELYLNRPLTTADAGLVRQIERKTRSIARHSHKNRL
jgi:heptose I phosphotransferase